MTIKLMKGDCLERMKEIPDKSIDMILCDLPYGVTNNKFDIVIPFEPLWEQYNRIIKKDGAILLFSQGLFYVDLVNSNRQAFKYDLIWDKVLTTGFLNAKTAPLRQHEQIAVFSYGKINYNPQMAKGQPNHSKGNAKFGEVLENNKNYGKMLLTESNFDGLKYPTSIIRFPKPHPSVAKHRTEKSTDLLEWLIKTYTNKGDTVLDNCMGSGTTGLACIYTDRNFIGIEKDEDYFKVSCDRIREELPIFRKKDLIIV